MSNPQQIDLSVPLKLSTAFRFPIQSKASRNEVLIGALWLLVPFVGWILNMGHRIIMTHRMQNGLSAWPSWSNYPNLFKHGIITFLGMLEYHMPAVLCEVAALRLDINGLHFLAAMLWLLATIAVPGYMSHYCHSLDVKEIFNPIRAMKRVFEGGTSYWKAWCIALLALVCSLLGLLGFGVGFFITSVWFWQVAGYSFSVVFTKQFELSKRANKHCLT